MVIKIQFTDNENHIKEHPQSMLKSFENWTWTNKFCKIKNLDEKMFFVLCLIVSLAAAGANPVNDEGIQPMYQLENVLKTESFAQLCNDANCHKQCVSRFNLIGVCDRFACFCGRCTKLGQSCSGCCADLCKTIGGGRRGGSCDRIGRCSCQW
jgi:hypothetical protein